ncbi:MAG: WYL domain-containing protein [Candidatus Cryptobacteroides sp.]
MDIKTVYIDENFDKVLTYLHSCSSGKDENDSFYATTIDLLDRRVNEIMDEIALRHVFVDDDAECNRDRLTFMVRLFAAFLLVRSEDASMKKLQVAVHLLSTLSSLVPRNYSSSLIELAVDVMAGRRELARAFGWNDILEFQPQVLSHKIITNSGKAIAPVSGISYTGKGCLEISDGMLLLSAKAGASSDPSLVRSMGIFEDAIQIMTPKNLKFKHSDTGNIDRYIAFTEDFIASQKEGTALKSYSNGDTPRVKITGSSNRRLNVRSVDPKYVPFEGHVQLRPMLYFSIDDFRMNLAEGDEIRVEIVDIENGICSIESEFVKFIIEEWAQHDFGKEVLAHYIDTNVDRTGRTKIVWWTEWGYCAYSNDVEDVHKGDYAYIKVENHGRGKYYGYINANFVAPADTSFDERESRDNCIRHFSYGRSEEIHNAKSLPASLITELARMLVSYQKGLLRPSERFEILCVARILTELMEDSEDSAYINFISNYLMNLVAFTKGEIPKMKEIVADSSFASLEPVLRKHAMVEVLRCFGDDSRNEWLSEMIAATGDGMLRKTAILVQSCNRLDEIISKSMQNVIKREITKCLSIDPEGEADLEEENGTYLGIENSRQEFKTSFFIAPANAREQDQRMTIMKGICAFLNSTGGGTLYLGVNDLGYVQGIASDLEYMEKKVFGTYKGIDGYIRCITDEARKHFDIGVLTHVDIVDMYDSQVIAINIRPYTYGVVELDGTAYVRLNSETVVMSETARRLALDRCISASAGKSANAGAVLEAIRGKRKAVFHGYSSSSGGERRDRIVEPFAINAGYTHIWCYDIEKKRNAVFRTDRIGNVEVKGDAWEYSGLHEQLKMDAFHMTGEKPVHAVLKLDLMAKNLLCEEYPEAESSLAATDDSNTWILDIDVYAIEGLGRFYMGLAADIEIIDAPELVSYVRDYAKKYLVF